MTEIKKTPCWMESGRRTESGVPEVIMEGRHKGTRGSRLRFARKMGERKTREDEIKQEKELTEWQKVKKDYKSRGVPMVKRKKLTGVQEKFGARRVE